MFDLCADRESEVDEKERTGSIYTISKNPVEKYSYINTSKGWGARHTLCFYLWSGTASVFLSRVGLSIAIVSMVSSNGTGINDTSEVCPLPLNSSDSLNDTLEGEFDWNEQTQGIILGCFYYGYIVSNFLGGLATEYFGGRVMMTVTVLGSSLLTLLSPLCARLSLPLFIASRVACGLAQGPLASATSILLASWIPPEEKAKLCSITFTGAYIGTVASMSLGGIMIESGFLGGWPSVFYVFGAVGVLWTIPWLWLIRDRPEEHNSISDAELSYIKANKATLKRSERVEIPWAKLATSVPFWCLIAVSWGNNFGFFNLLTEIPTYLKNIQHLPIQYNGLVSALPYAVCVVFSICWGIFANYLIYSKKFPVIRVRKLSSSVAMFGPAVALVMMCFVDCNPVLAILCLCISVGVNSACNCGADISDQEIAPNLAGTLKGIINAIGSLTGILAPLITGAITNGNQTLGAWRAVFIISALTYCITCSIYLFFGTNEVQPWNEPRVFRTTLKQEIKRPKTI